MSTQVHFRRSPEPINAPTAKLDSQSGVLSSTLELLNEAGSGSEQVLIVTGKEKVGNTEVP